ncbi:MAG: hypothetical protein IJ955_08450 [Oscillospiraceae bacterium]|nr:hypothetical protein [Oscillospiraceae bacterium]
MGNDRNRIAFRMRAETAQKIEQWQKASNCRSKNEFIEKAVNFYADYLALNNDNQLLPKAVLSTIEGRLGLLEKNLSAATFNHAVELDMLVGIIAQSYQFSQNDLEKRRAQSVRNVKATNGRVSLEKCARAYDSQNWDDDEWQS